MSNLLSNRAQVHLRLLNNRLALEDAQNAVEADGTNVKVALLLKEATSIETNNKLSDCIAQKASLVSETPLNLQAFFRGATAAERLKEYQKARELCKQGLAAEPSSPELLKLSEVRTFTGKSLTAFPTLMSSCTCQAEKTGINSFLNFACL